MFRPLKYAAMLTCVAFVAAPPAQADEDPCAGYDVACDGDGCTACWPGQDVDLICDEYTQLEINLTLPGCVDSHSTFDILDFTVKPPRVRPPLTTRPPHRPVTPTPVNPTIQVKVPGAN